MHNITKLVFATHNRHKLEELRSICGNSINIYSPSDFGLFEDILETGNSLESNALLKAQFVHSKLLLNCFADDTGLEVEALDGAPGIFSARYAGENKDSKKNIEKLLYELKYYTNRKAQFRTVIALIIKNKPFYFEGIITGQIIKESRGSFGFGYDSVFIPDGYTRTFAELSDIIKNNISHRAIAVNKMLDFLKQYEQDQIPRNTLNI